MGSWSIKDSTIRTLLHGQSKLKTSHLMLLKFKRLLTQLAFVIALSHTVHSATILWTKDLPDGNYIYEVGSDGSVAITTWESSESSVLYWYDYSGELIAELDRSQSPFVESIRHVSERDLLYEGRDAEYNRFTVSASLDENDESDEVKIHHDFTGNRNPTVMAFPFFLSRVTGQSDVATFTLWLIADQPDISVVGDIVTGASEDTLHIRWTTEPRAIYKIQVSGDLETWTDYTDEIQGDGTTKFEDIPITEESQFARVVQL